jgi:hypothetical protein
MSKCFWQVLDEEKRRVELTSPIPATREITNEAFSRIYEDLLQTGRISGTLSFRSIVYLFDEDENYIEHVPLSGLKERAEAYRRGVPATPLKGCSDIPLNAESAVAIIGEKTAALYGRVPSQSRTYFEVLASKAASEGLKTGESVGAFFERLSEIHGLVRAMWQAGHSKMLSRSKLAPQEQLERRRVHDQFWAPRAPIAFKRIDPDAYDEALETSIAENSWVFPPAVDSSADVYLANRYLRDPTIDRILTSMMVTDSINTDTSQRGRAFQKSVTDWFYIRRLVGSLVAAWAIPVALYLAQGNVGGSGHDLLMMMSLLFGILASALTLSLMILLFLPVSTRLDGIWIRTKAASRASAMRQVLDDLGDPTKSPAHIQLAMKYAARLGAEWNPRATLLVERAVAINTTEWSSACDCNQVVFARDPSQGDCPDIEASTGVIQDYSKVVSNPEIEQLEILLGGAERTSYDRDLSVTDATDLALLTLGLRVSGNLTILDQSALTSLPVGLCVGGDLYVDGCNNLISLPMGLSIGGSLTIRACGGLTELPSNLEILNNLNLDECSGLRALPKGLLIGGTLSLKNCDGLTVLTEEFSTGRGLRIERCANLTTLPEVIDAFDMEIISCDGLTELPEMLYAGRLIIKDCLSLRLTRPVRALDLKIENCPNLDSIPPVYRMLDSCVEVINCPGLSALPEEMLVADLVLNKCLGFVVLTGTLCVDGNLTFIDCLNLNALPVGLEVYGTLSLSGCTSLATLPVGLIIKGDLRLIGCTNLRELPDDLSVGGQVYR